MRAYQLVVICVINALSWGVLAQETTRGAMELSPSNPTTKKIERWALIVGISKHKHSSIDLKYARRDAESLASVLQSPSGGAFPKDHIMMLLDEQATTAGITGALRGFMKKPARDDLVIIYFASHGAPDPDRPKNVYLLTYDTDPQDIASTATQSFSNIYLERTDVV